MLKRCISLWLALCLLLTLTACGGKTQDQDTPATSVQTTTTTKPVDTQEPLAPAIAPTFAAMPQKTQDMAEVYRLSDSVVLFAFITPELDAAATELVCYDLSSDTLLGELNLGECWVSLFPLENGFAVLDYDKKTYTAYDTACAVKSTSALVFDGAIGTAAQNGDRLLLSDMRTGLYFVYDLATQAAVPVKGTVTAEYSWVGNHQNAFLLCGYNGGVVAVDADGQSRIVTAAATGAQVVGTTHIAGVVGDYAVFYPLAGGEAEMLPTHGAENFCTSDGNGLLSVSGKEARYYNLSRRTVTTYTAAWDIAAVAVRKGSAVMVLREEYGQPLTFAYVDVAALPAESMNAAAYDSDTLADRRPLPEVSGVAAEIQETYGVTVIGDVDFFDLSVFGYTAEAASAAQIAYRTEELKVVLDFFPDGIFKEIGAKTPVVVVLCQELGNAAGGINTVLDGYAVSYLSVTGNDAFFENVAAHELAHAVERQMSTADLDGWVSMQPAEVQAAYGNLSLTVEYTADDKGETPTWFVSVYGRTEPIEDRATVFAAMYDAYAEGDASALNYDGLKQKVAYWSRMLRATYACCADATFAWDSLFE